MHWTHLVYGPYRDGMFDLDRFIADCRDALASVAPSAAGRSVHLAPLPGAAGSQRGLVSGHGDLSARAPDVGSDRLYGGREENTFYRRSARALEVDARRRLDGSETARLDVERARRVYAQANERDTMDRA